MIEANFHPCDEIQRFGYTAHGLLHGRFDLLLRVNDVDFPLPFEWPALRESYEVCDTHLVRVPGVAEVDISPEEFAAEQAAGRTWQNYALLSSESLTLFGHVLDGWVCVDSAGQRWLIRADPVIRMQTLQIDVPLELNMSVVPFGYLDEETVDPVLQVVTLADLGQVGDITAPPGAVSDPLTRQLRVGSVSSDGRKAILELHGVQDGALQIRRDSAPSGILLLEVSGDGPSFTFTLTVLKTQVQCAGVFAEQRVGPPAIEVELAWDIATTPSEPLPGYPGLDVVAKIDGVSTVPWIGGVDGHPLHGTGYVGATRTDRILAMVFDDADSIVEFTYSVEHRADYVFPDFGLESTSGELTGWIGDPATSTTLAGSVDYRYGRNATETLVGEITIGRDGVTVAGSKFERTRTIYEWYQSTTITGGRLARPAPGGELSIDSISGPGLPSSGVDFTEVVTAGEGAGHATWEVTSSYDGLYTGLAMLLPLTVTLTPSPWGYGASVASSVGGEHASVTLRLQRYSNHLSGVRLHLAAGSQPQQYRVHRIAGTQAVWENGVAGADSPTWEATYHPLTHEIYVESGSSDAAAAVFL